MGGTIVYSTCSLSPIQNEAVVNTVMGMFGADSSSDFTLVAEDLSSMRTFFDYFYSFSAHCKLGARFMKRALGL